MRAATLPISIRLELVVLSREAFCRSFLTYTFPSCSPDPDHLTVLARPGFVEAACQPSLRSKRQTASNSTNLLRQAGGGGLEPPLGARAPRGARCRRPKSG